MKASGLLSIAVLIIFLAAGCSTPKQTASTDPASKDKAAEYQPNQQKTARVLVDGKEKAVTPATVTVRRGFGEMDVSLVAGGKTVRKFELDRTYTSDAGSLVYSYFGDESGNVVQYDVQALSRTKKGAYIIPFVGQPIQIEDREYGLTLLIN